RWWESRTSAVISATEIASVTSAVCAEAGLPSAAATSSAPSPLMSTTATRAPSRANARQVAAPMPLAPPVTTTTLPTNRPEPSLIDVLLRHQREHGRDLDPKARVRAHDRVGIGDGTRRSLVFGTYQTQAVDTGGIGDRAECHCRPGTRQLS